MLGLFAVLGCNNLLEFSVMEGFLYCVLPGKIVNLHQQSTGLLHLVAQISTFPETTLIQYASCAFVITFTEIG